MWPRGQQKDVQHAAYKHWLMMCCESEALFLSLNLPWCLRVSEFIWKMLRIQSRIERSNLWGVVISITSACRRCDACYSTSEDPFSDDGMELHLSSIAWIPLSTNTIARRASSAAKRPCSLSPAVTVSWFNCHWELHESVETHSEDVQDYT